jgi:hypothetical protein
VEALVKMEEEEEQNSDRLGGEALNAKAYDDANLGQGGSMNRSLFCATQGMV